MLVVKEATIVQRLGISSQPYRKVRLMCCRSGGADVASVVGCWCYAEPMPVRLDVDIDRTDVAVVVTVMMIFVVTFVVTFVVIFVMIFVKGVEGL
jgi:hypothetical protein